MYFFLLRCWATLIEIEGPRYLALSSLPRLRDLSFFFLSSGVKSAFLPGMARVAEESNGPGATREAPSALGKLWEVLGVQGRGAQDSQSHLPEPPRFLRINPRSKKVGATLI